MYKVLSSITFLLFFFLPVRGKNGLLTSSNLEEIKVAHQFISIILFDDEVKEVLIPSKDYVANVNQNVILLRATKQHALPSSLIVTFKHGKQVFNGLLSYTNKSQQTYDFRTKEEDLEKEAQKEDPAQKEEVIEKIRYITSKPQECFNIGMYGTYHDVILTNVFNDDHYTYLKIYVENKTALNFELFEANFRHFNSKKNRAIVHPIYGLENRVIPAYSYRMLVYVLPRYTTKKNGKLLVTFSEQSGSRVINLSIPAYVLLEAKYYGKIE